MDCRRRLSSFLPPKKTFLKGRFHTNGPNPVVYFNIDTVSHRRNNFGLDFPPSLEKSPSLIVGTKYNIGFWIFLGAWKNYGFVQISYHYYFLEYYFGYFKTLNVPSYSTSRERANNHTIQAPYDFERARLDSNRLTRLTHSIRFIIKRTCLFGFRSSIFQKPEDIYS